MTKPLEISVAETARALVAEDSSVPILLDCRTDEEFAAGSIDSAVHIPLQSLHERLAELDEFQDRDIIVYCHHGRRSLMATEILRNSGFKNAQSMYGGIDQWSIQIDDSIARY